MMTRILLSLFIIQTLAFAAEFSVKSFERVDNDLAARRYEKKDVNGDVCAIVKIRTDIPKPFLFNANTGIEAVEYRDNNEIWLWVMDGARQLTVAKDGYITLKYNVPQRIASSTVYSMVLTGDGNKLTVSILSDPADASKIVDGEDLGTGESFKLTAGTHELRLRKEGYRGETRTISVDEDHTLFKDITLTKISVTAVTVTSEPSGADVYINGVLRGQTYWSDFLFPERYELRLVKPGYLDYTETVEIRENIQNDLKFNLTKNAAWLTVTVLPSDAQIIIDNQPKTAGKIELLPGEHSISIMKSGYLPQMETVNLELGTETVRSYTLDKNIGILSLNIQPADAEVFINKRSYGTQRRIELAPGMVQVEIRREQYFEQSDIVQIVRGEETVKSYGLEMQSGTLQFKVQPNRSSVLMKDGKGETFSEWQGLKLMPDIPVGRYQLEVSFPDYLTTSREIEILHDRTTEVDMTLLSYAGSIQQQKDALTFKRNISGIGSAILAAAAIGLKLKSMSDYDAYQSADDYDEMLRLFSSANTMNKVSTVFAVTAGAVLIPGVKFQIDLQTFRREMK